MAKDHDAWSRIIDFDLSCWERDDPTRLAYMEDLQKKISGSKITRILRIPKPISPSLMTLLATKLPTKPVIFMPHHETTSLVMLALARNTKHNHQIFLSTRMSRETLLATAQNLKPRSTIIILAKNAATHRGNIIELAKNINAECTLRLLHPLNYQGVANDVAKHMKHDAILSAVYSSSATTEKKANAWMNMAYHMNPGSNLHMPAYILAPHIMTNLVMKRLPAGITLMLSDSNDHLISKLNEQSEMPTGTKFVTMASFCRQQSNAQYNRGAPAPAHESPLTPQLQYISDFNVEAVLQNPNTLFAAGVKYTYISPHTGL